MKRLVLEFFLLVGAVVAGVYAWHLHTQLGVDTTKVQTMTERGEQAGQKLEEATKTLETAPLARPEASRAARRPAAARVARSLPQRADRSAGGLTRRPRRSTARRA